MPADITVQLAPGVPSYMEVAIVGPIRDDRPLPEDLNHVVSTEPSSIDRLQYSAPALSTAHSTRAGFYFCGDFNHQTQEIGDVLTFDRVWANLPRSFTRAAGTYPYRFPGLPGGSVGSPVTITALSPIRGNVAVITPTCTSVAHSFNVGDRLALSLTYASVTITGGVIITSKTTDTYTTTPLLLSYQADGTFDYGNFTTGTATLSVTSRAPKVMPVDSIEAFSYALPGVTSGIATAADFRASPLFQPYVTSSGAETDVLSGLTTPTTTAYRASVAAGAYLVAESAIAPYRGLILQRRDLLVRYT